MSFDKISILVYAATHEAVSFALIILGHSNGSIYLYANKFEDFTPNELMNEVGEGILNFPRQINLGLFWFTPPAMEKIKLPSIFE